MVQFLFFSAGESVIKGEALVTFTDGSDPITAPEAGVVTTVSVASGEKVTNGQAVAHLTNYSDVQTIVNPFHLRGVLFVF
ncbi:MAG: biotin/lipoyl-containing protein [Bacillota bacterium]|nr:biotin/lipoyl-containing protein [Bacillota bacterium]